MTILADFVWNSPADYLVERSAVWGALIIWHDMCALGIGQPTTLREVPYGGYKLRIEFAPSFWEHTSSAWRHDQLLLDFYAMAPSSSTPISAGTVNREIVFYPALGQYVVNFNTVPSGNVGMWYRFPPATENAGSELFPAQIPHQFYTTPIIPGVLQPVPYC